jgi:hypothetical protein
MEKKADLQLVQKTFLQVKVIPRAKNPGVLRREDGSFVVRVTAPPEKGKANQEVMERLASFFNLPLKRFQIHKGHTSRHKVIVINEP